MANIAPGKPMIGGLAAALLRAVRNQASFGLGPGAEHGASHPTQHHSSRSNRTDAAPSKNSNFQSLPANHALQRHNLGFVFFQ